MSINPSLLFKTFPKELTPYFSEDLPPWEILKGDLKKYFKSQKKENQLLGKISPKAHLEGEGIFIHKDATVEAFAFITGPCHIGAGSVVRHSAYIRGNVFIGENCVVGHSTEVKHSIFFEGAKAGHFNYIGDSILGNNVNLGAGTKLANLKMTSGTVKLKINKETIDSELRKFGALIGDKVETGCNSVLNPGTILAPKSLVFPNTSAFGVHLKKVILR